MPDGYTDAQLQRAAKAIHEVTGGFIGFGNPRRKASKSVRVSAQLVAEAALDAATTAVVVEPLTSSSEGAV